MFAAAAAIACLFVPALAASQTLEFTLGQVESLADMGCSDGHEVGGSVGLDSGYIGLFGIGEADYGLQVVSEGTRALMVPARQCGRLGAPSDAVIVLSHFYLNKVRVREGYYYLMTPQGELLKAVHFLEGRSNPFVLANPRLPLIRADFESEKYIWLTRLDRNAREARAVR